MKTRLRVAVDGPAGTGKSTVCKRLADRHHLLYVDTGAMYRAMAWSALEGNVPIDDEKALEEFLKQVDIQLHEKPGGLLITASGRDVSEEIRTTRVTDHSSRIAVCGQVRRWMVEKQKALAQDRRVIMEGRDIGTVVIPDAEVKVFLTADEKTRAQRRYLQLKEKGSDVSLEEILAQQALRDQRDSTRADSPTTQAHDARLVDTAQMTTEEVVGVIGTMIKRVDEG